MYTPVMLLVHFQLVNIDDTLNNLKVNLSDQSVLNADTEKSLMDLKNSSVDKINFTSFFNEVNIALSIH